MSGGHQATGLRGKIYGFVQSSVCEYAVAVVIVANAIVSLSRSHGKEGVWGALELNFARFESRVRSDRHGS